MAGWGPAKISLGKSPVCFQINLARQIPIHAADPAFSVEALHQTANEFGADGSRPAPRGADKMFSTPIDLRRIEATKGSNLNKAVVRDMGTTALEIIAAAD